MSFESLGLTPALCHALTACGYTEPTPIQRASIPLVLDGGDLLASAQTGTGKTAAFALPLLQKLFVDGRRSNLLAPRQARVLVLTPTRELAAQIHQSFIDYAGALPLKSAVVFGGVGMPAQVKALAGGLDVLIATPGRLLDHAQQRTVDLSAVATVVLDEADRMLDMGFLPAIKRVLALLPKRRQTLLYSATFSAPIKALAAQFLHQPREVAATVRNAAATTVSHLVHPVAPGHKRELLLHLLARDSRQQTLVFTRTKHGANRMAEFLSDAGLAAAAIHGNKSQGARTRALADFKAHKVTVLVATDIAARGLDIEQLPMVVNVDLPHVAEDYVHRIGRTGRAGAEGQAISLVSPDERGLLREIEKLIGRAIPVEQVADFVPSARASAVEAPRPPRPPQPARRTSAPAAARKGPPTDAATRKASPQAAAPRPSTSPTRTRSFGGRARGGR